MSGKLLPTPEPELEPSSATTGSQEGGLEVRGHESHEVQTQKTLQRLLTEVTAKVGAAP